MTTTTTTTTTRKAKFEYYDTSYAGTEYLMKIDVESREIFIKNAEYVEDRWDHIWSISICNILNNGAKRISDEEMFMRML
jgi:hypothetical protein